MKSERRRTYLQNACVVVPVAIVHSAVYRFLTRHDLSTPHLLEPTWIDDRIPFLVWTIWPYAALVVICIAGPLLVRTPDVFRRTVIAYVSAVVMLLAFYLCMPTMIHRLEHDPLPSSWTWLLYRQFADGLGASCCFPSGHIVFPMIGCWAMLRDGVRGALAVAVFAALSSFSILTTKEHVAWDWLGGVAVGTVAIVLADRWKTTPTTGNRFDE